MEKLFCNKCREERDIIESGRNGAATFYLLSCGHRSLMAGFTDSLNLSELFGFRKKGETNVKHTQGDRLPNINYVKKFIEYGDIDYEAALVLFDIQERNYDFMNQASFFCAQSVEKYLKAFLFWNSEIHYPGHSGKQVLEEFKRLSHNLNNILKECIKDNDGFSNFTEQVEAMNKYSLLKYPDVEDDMIYSESGLTISSEIAKDVKTLGDFIKKLIGGGEILNEK